MMPNASRTDRLRALLTAVAITPHPALWLWLGPCGPWLSATLGRAR